MKHDNSLQTPVVAHPEGFGQSSSAQEPDSLTSNQDNTSDDDPVIPEQDLAPIKARVKEYIHRHIRQFHHVYHSSSPSSGNGEEELHQTVWMLKRAQRINSDLWFVQRSLTDEKGVTRTQLHTQLLPKLDACLKELDTLHSLKREVSKRQVKREVQVPMKKGRKDSKSSAWILMRSFFPFHFRRPALLKVRR